MDLTHARELLHRINLLCARGVISVDTPAQLHDFLAHPRVDAASEQRVAGNICEPRADEARVTTNA